MDQFFESRYPYNLDGSYLPESPVSSEWTTSHSASTPMTREPSGESSITSRSSELVGTPGSEYGVYSSTWSSMPFDNDDHLWSPASSSNHDITFSSMSYNNPYISDIEYNGNDYNAGDQDAWWPYYDFIVEYNRPPYWRLKAGLQPTDQLPATRAAEDLSATIPRSQANEGVFVCLEKDCTRSFRRKADLERHYSQRHTPADKKAKFPCDWKRCQRSRDAFHRRDHQRDHLREYHHEDLMRRGSSSREDEKWWDSRVIKPDWWRCARCLTRVNVAKHGYTCSECGTSSRLSLHSLA
ncbi:hypothetical protein ONZ43_g2142 [Nemania bipapillata]|uniref:Uncharacterized protein n=1 Tax=Nemania bipapillata TaxID=110536 RepID=A0ACC2J1T1_9PEZI|nr:hypothetical protein ONZ43_g2142 [Nemania bipapillata]